MFSLATPWQRAVLIALLLISHCGSQSAYAHLMTAQKGTLNIVDKKAYVVISLPITAFAGTDSDQDGRVELEEFNRNRRAIVSSIVEQVTLSDAQHRQSLEGIMLSPTTPHDGSGNAITQLVVMGQFSLESLTGPLRFEVGLFGPAGSERLLEMSASNRSVNLRSAFELTPASPSSMLFWQSY